MTDFKAMTARLNEIAGELRDDEVGDERAEELAREAAELVGRAGNEIERALREAASGE
ncbi:MAG: hypothetical protein M3383_03960 [Actinomycetota bacterium]|nr:hypothetical protein [Actinomycetota bacterium]